MSSRWVALVFFVAVLNFISTSALKVSCKNEENRDVDWYYLYKLPKHYSNTIDSDVTGLRYAYMTSEANTTTNWQLSSVSINETASFTGRTLATLFDDPEVLLIAYNDEVPDGPTDFENGHTKGVVATDGFHAIWLVHSVPKFPRIPNYSYPPTGQHFGQSFLCVTLNATSQMDVIAAQLLFNEPNIYFSRIPAGLSGKYPDLEKVLAKQWRTTAPYLNIEELESLNGTLFKSFAKGRHFNAELYKDLVAPRLDVDLFVESWRNSAGKLPSDCSQKDKVFNVAMITAQYNSHELSFSFKTSMDHSKWAVAKEDEDDWICVGDINRAEHQLVRGGGTVCQKNKNIANTYRGIIADFDKCKAI